MDKYVLDVERYLKASDMRVIVRQQPQPHRKQRMHSNDIESFSESIKVVENVYVPPLSDLYCRFNFRASLKLSQRRDRAITWMHTEFSIPESEAAEFYKSCKPPTAVQSVTMDKPSVKVERNAVSEGKNTLEVGELEAESYPLDYTNKHFRSLRNRNIHRKSRENTTQTEQIVDDANDKRKESKFDKLEIETMKAKETQTDKYEIAKYDKRRIETKEAYAETKEIDSGYPSTPMTNIIDTNKRLAETTNIEQTLKTSNPTIAERGTKWNPPNECNTPPKAITRSTFPVQNSHQSPIINPNPNLQSSRQMESAENVIDVGSSNPIPPALLIKEELNQIQRIGSVEPLDFDMFEYMSHKHVSRHKNRSIIRKLKSKAKAWIIQ